MSPLVGIVFAKHEAKMRSLLLILPFALFSIALPRLSSANIEVSERIPETQRTTESDPPQVFRIRIQLPWSKEAQAIAKKNRVGLQGIEVQEYVNKPFEESFRSTLKLIAPKSHVLHMGEDYVRNDVDFNFINRQKVDLETFYEILIVASPNEIGAINTFVSHWDLMSFDSFKKIPIKLEWKNQKKGKRDTTIHRTTIMLPIPRNFKKLTEAKLIKAAINSMTSQQRKQITGIPQLAAASAESIDVAIKKTYADHPLANRKQENPKSWTRKSEDLKKLIKQRINLVQKQTKAKFNKSRR